jgi:septal ring factor EnvC (AmiA/AmiB activator)
MASIIDQIRFVLTGFSAKLKAQADEIAELTAALAEEDEDDQELQDAAAKAVSERDALQAQLETVTSAFETDQAQDAAQEGEITSILAPFVEMFTPPVEEPPAEPETPAEPPAEPGAPVEEATEPA